MAGLLWHFVLAAVAATRLTSPMNCSDGGRFGHRRAPGSGPGPAGSTLSLPED